MARLTSSILVLRSIGIPRPHFLLREQGTLATPPSTLTWEWTRPGVMIWSHLPTTPSCTSFAVPCQQVSNLQAVLPLCILGGRRLATLLSLYMLELIPLSCARAFHSPIPVVLNHFIYSLRKAPYIPLSHNCPCLDPCPSHVVVVLLPILHFFRSYHSSLEGEHDGRGYCVLLMYSPEIALAKPINSCP